MAVLLMKQTIIKGCVVYKYTLKYRACTGKAACVHPQTLSRAGGMCLDPTRSASPCSYIGSHRTQALVGCSEEEEVSSKWILSISSDLKQISLVFLIGCPWPHFC